MLSCHLTVMFPPRRPTKRSAQHVLPRVRHLESHVCRNLHAL
jgi:hypothetical protein